VPSLNNTIVDFFEHVERFDSIVNDSHAKMGQLDTRFDGLIQIETFCRLQAAQSRLVFFVNEFLHQTLVLVRIFWAPTHSFHQICVISHCFYDSHAAFELLFRADKSLATVDHLLDQFYFGEPDPLVVGNVPLSAGAGRCVLAAAAPGLDAESLGEIFELMWSESLG